MFNWNLRFFLSFCGRRRSVGRCRGGIFVVAHRALAILVVLSLGGSIRRRRASTGSSHLPRVRGVKLAEASGYNFAKLKVMIESGNVNGRG